MQKHRRLPWTAVAGVTALAFLTGSASAAVGHVLLALVMVLVAAKVGGDIAMRVKQPPVLGELIAGVIVGNLGLVGIHAFEWIAQDEMMTVLAEIGVILLLFEVGLESTLGQMARVGTSAFVVATLGVVAPMLLGLGVSTWLLPDESFYVHLFLGAILCATSVGITARVLQDIGASKTPEARVILGAAVIDDVLGLVILAAVAGVISAADAGQSAGVGPILLIVGKTLGFLVAAGLLGVFVVPRVLDRASRLRGTGVMLGLTLAFCFAMSFAALEVGLAPIVGAFAAGLVLEHTHYQAFVDHGERQIEELVRPIVQFLAPVFFVLMGFKVDLSAFARTEVLVLAGALTLAGVLGKLACALGVLDKSIRRFPVAIGMIPRGEVGLIFADVGSKLVYQGRPVIDAGIFSAVVIVVIVTTLLTPPVLTAAMRERAPSPA